MGDSNSDTETLMIFYNILGEEGAKVVTLHPNSAVSDLEYKISKDSQCIIFFAGERLTRYDEFLSDIGLCNESVVDVIIYDDTFKNKNILKKTVDMTYEYFDFSGTTFHKSIENTTYINCIFDKTSFDRIELIKVNFSKYTFKGSEFCSSTVKNTLFDECILTNSSYFMLCKFSECEIKESDLSDHIFVETDLNVGITWDNKSILSRPKRKMMVLFMIVYRT